MVTFPRFSWFSSSDGDPWGGWCVTHPRGLRMGWADAEKAVWVPIFGWNTEILIIWQKGSGKCSCFQGNWNGLWVLVGIPRVTSVEITSGG